jgi:hypothetical protein
MSQKVKLKKSYGNKEIFSSAALTSFITYNLLGLSKTIEPEHFMSPFLSDASISFFASFMSISLVFIFSLLRFRVDLIILDWEYNHKIKFLDKLISNTENSKLINELKDNRDQLIVKASKEVKDKIL